MSNGLGYWNRKYARSEFVYGRRPNQFLVEQAPKFLSSEAEILSLGEGEGRNAVWLARQGWSVTAVDYSAPALEKLRSHSRKSGVKVETHCSDVLDFDCGVDRWDSVALLHVHLEPRRRRKLHRRIARSLRVEGVLLLEALRIEQLQRSSGGPQSPDLLYTTDILRRDFHDLAICLLTEDDRCIHAGEHRGMTSVVSLVAKKAAPYPE